MPNTAFYPGEIYLPNAENDYSKWSVVACDQFTSQPEYWEEVSAFVGDAPSTLKITLPEIYLEQDGVDERIAKINAAMDEYLKSEILKSAGSRYIYVERTQRDGVCRRGLMGVVDLEEYNYLPGSTSLIRATEGTVLERIPPRVRVRENAALEIPHIMLLIDDPEKSVIEPLTDAAADMDVAYDFTLMQQSGSIKGYFVDDKNAAAIGSALEKLADPAVCTEKYGVSDKGVLLFAVGDGNHSLATAKTIYEELKATLGEEAARVHPARYALVEVVNLHDDALQFEPIYRVVFDCNPDELLAELRAQLDAQSGTATAQTIRYFTADKEGELTVEHPVAQLAVGTLQNFLSEYTQRHPNVEVDYIHGEDSLIALAKKPNAIGFLFDGMRKDELFRTVLYDGALPRKTFSMGHAADKRYYLECRKIK